MHFLQYGRTFDTVPQPKGIVMQQVSEQESRVQVSWGDLLAGVREGDVEMSLALQHRLKAGLRIVLARKALRDREETVMAEVLSAVLDLVRKGDVSSPEDLAKAARAAVTERLEPRRPVLSEKSVSTPSVALNTHLSVRERDMLRRYYVLAQDPAEICRSLGVSMEEFHRAKSLARAAVAVSLASMRNTGTYA